MVEIRMPRLSEGMTEGKLLFWNVAVGDYVEAGDQLAEVEADKANMEIESPVSGLVCNLHGNVGDTIAVGTVLVELKEGAGGRSRPDNGAQSAESRPDVASEEHVESALERRKKQFSNGEQ